MIQRDTICFKHDEIMKLAQKVIDLTDEAKDCGIRMEEGLDKKRKRIDELESEVYDLQKQIEKLQEENAELAAELKAASL